MSFQLENPHPQPKNKPYIISSNLHEIHHDYDDDHLLISKVIPNPITLDLFHINQSSSLHKFENTSFDTKSKQKRSLEDQITSEETMSRRQGSNNIPKLDLKLNLSPPSSTIGATSMMESPTRSSSISPPSSCLSSDISMSSPESSPMVLVGCPRCLMYVMLLEDDPKCPKCKSTVLLDFVHDNNHNNNNNKKNCSNNGRFKKIKELN
ncbi:protein GL2-INTERACTING REPRESSOR 1 isoform X1 [Amaranthus tricolor]|uniref:protein GL2-INTERACTING REPRESSOR 1 isoform X1 n=1 Tax=Amaranthus tricolor TaxID=29722 RepID=UPI00258F2F59|nr:protein GL2-INTERACTING REPRESSOR 1 isoform X1 [Amaranthus tricolor]